MKARKIFAMVILTAALTTVALADDASIEEPELQDTETVMISDDAMLSSDEDATAEVLEYDATTDPTSNLDVELQQLVKVSDQIRTALLNGTAKIDLSGLSDLGITKTCDQFRHIGYYCPYLDGSNVSVKVYCYSDGTYAYLKVKNNLTATATKAWVEKIDAELANLENLLDSSASPAEQALTLHDYMAGHYDYDTTYTNYYPSQILTQHTGVCQCYTYLFQYIMNTRGINCYTTTSDTMNHAWNMMKIGDNYYHVDITWDDPIGETYGAAEHDFFLLSDNTISDSTHEHHDWNLTRFACTDTTYEMAA